MAHLLSDSVKEKWCDVALKMKLDESSSEQNTFLKILPLPGTNPSGVGWHWKGSRRKKCQRFHPKTRKCIHNGTINLMCLWLYSWWITTDGDPSRSHLDPSAEKSIRILSLMLKEQLNSNHDDRNGSRSSRIDHCLAVLPDPPSILKNHF